MNKKVAWLMVSCLIVTVLLMASCGPAVTEEEGEEATAPPATEQEVVTEEEEVAPPEEEAVTEEEEAAPPEEEAVTEEEEAAPTPSPAVTPEASIPIIDAHSQVCPENIDKVIELMDQAGVACTILSSGMTSTIGIVTPEELVSFASNYPGRIIPAVRIKVGKDEDYYKLLEKQVNMDGFGAMAEVLMYHGTEIPGRPVKLVIAHPDDESVQTALKYALDKEWPFIVHIEFVTAGSQRDVFMTELKALLVQYPEHHFVLIHMGQLDYAAVRQLIEAHDNIYFITSTSLPPPPSTNDVDWPWTNMFDVRNLSADWKQLMIDYPDRFIMGFDMVFPEQWGQFYLDVVALWQEAIKELPVEVAHALAHGNAERLWHLTQTAPLAPASAPSPDTTPPSAITGLVVNDAYDGRVNLWWDKSTAEAFAHYDIYMSQAEIVDTSGMTPVYQIKDIATNYYQATGLEEGTAYYFAVTAVDKSDNENTQVASANAAPTPMPRGTVDPDLQIDVYEPDMVWAGTTLLTENHNPERRRIIEVNMLGEIIWEYLVPESGFTEAELLSNNNILYTVSGKGVYEIDRNGEIVWSYLTSRVDHDADRLPNGNTIFVCAGDEKKSDAQVTEVNPKGEIVWQWYAKDYFDKPPYSDIVSEEGHWTHTNAVTRMANGNTFISLRNFNLVTEVDPQGAVVKIHGEGVFIMVHEPEILPNGNILAASHDKPPRAVEVDPETGEVVWQYIWREQDIAPVRDVNRLPNGNTLITGSTKIIEVTPDGEIVWQLGLKGITFIGPSGFYKAERISTQK